MNLPHDLKQPLGSFQLLTQSEARFLLGVALAICFLLDALKVAA